MECIVFSTNDITTSKWNVLYFPIIILLNLNGMYCISTNDITKLLDLNGMYCIFH